MGKYYGDELRKTLTIFLVILLPVVALLCYILVGLPLIEKTKKVTPVTFETIAEHEKDKVSIQGLLYPGSSVHSSTSCSCGGNWCSSLELIPLETEGDDWIFDDLEVIVEMDTTYSAEPGHFYLPDSYTYDDLIIYSSTGQELRHDAAIQVIGTVKYIYPQGKKTIVMICPYQIQAGERDCSKLVPPNDYKTAFLWDFEPVDRARIIHIMSDRWEPNLPEFKFFLPAGQTVSFAYGGGSVWVEQPGCPNSAWAFYQDDPLREITSEQYQKYIDEKVIP